MQPAILTPAIPAPRLSQLTRLERDAYMNRGGDSRGGDLDMTFGYPDDLAPGWFGHHQVTPQADFLRIPPSEFIDVISGYFRSLFGSEVLLIPTCSMAFAIAVSAVVQPGDEVIVIDCSYDSWPIILQTQGARVVYARRTAAGLPDVASAAAAVYRPHQGYRAGQPGQSAGRCLPGRCPGADRDVVHGPRPDPGH